MITHLDHLTTQHKTLGTSFPQCDNIATIHSKCNTKDTLCDDHDDTCAIMLKNLEMSVADVYIVRKTRIHKYKPLKLLEKVCKHGKIVKHSKRRQLIQQAKRVKGL